MKFNLVNGYLEVDVIARQDVDTHSDLTLCVIIQGTNSFGSTIVRKGTRILAPHQRIQRFDGHGVCAYFIPIDAIVTVVTTT